MPMRKGAELMPGTTKRGEDLSTPMVEYVDLFVSAVHQIEESLLRIM